MAEHEHPYFERPERLRYPTETWSAQDARKSDALYFAARHASSDERRQFLERAQFFYQSSVSGLRGAATRGLARPVVIMSTSGYMHSWIGGATLPEPDDERQRRLRQARRVYLAAQHRRGALEVAGGSGNCHPSRHGLADVVAMTSRAGRGKDAVLSVSRFAGLFHLARCLTRRRLRILCYHGFATGDVLEFRPGLFISPETFERRLSFLASAGYPVLTLEAALAGLDRGDLPPHATVITVDDVFQGFVEHAMPLLKAYRLPVTAYVTTYYAEHREPVFRLVVRYMFWKTREAALHVTAGEGQPALMCTRTDSASWHRAQDTLIAFGEQLPSEKDRTELAKRLGLLLRVDYDSIVANGVFNIVSTEQVRMLASEGVDIQLHTHRHRLPERKDLVTREIADNRRVLQPLVIRRLTIFAIRAASGHARFGRGSKNAESAAPRPVSQDSTLARPPGWLFGAFSMLRISLRSVSRRRCPVTNPCSALSSRGQPDDPECSGPSRRRRSGLGVASRRELSPKMARTGCLVRMGDAVSRKWLCHHLVLRLPRSIRAAPRLRHGLGWRVEWLDDVGR